MGCTVSKRETANIRKAKFVAAVGDFNTTFARWQPTRQEVINGLNQLVEKFAKRQKVKNFGIGLIKSVISPIALLFPAVQAFTPIAGILSDLGEYGANLIMTAFNKPDVKEAETLITKDTEETQQMRQCINTLRSCADDLKQENPGCHGRAKLSQVTPQDNTLAAISLMSEKFKLKVDAVSNIQDSLSAIATSSMVMAKGSVSEVAEQLRRVVKDLQQELDDIGQLRDELNHLPA